ncbi:hATC-domain-containing protein [Auricularia subglabra TFB-10046 SS5]|nr:hATC-domain-containing protein [Auricularia subglabra TFB-10046 SS5]
MAITLDNASNNTAMVRSLQRTLPDFEGEDVHGNCIAHILNLIAKAITAPFGRRFPKSSAEGEGDVQDAERRDAEGGNTEDAVEAEEPDEELDEEIEKDEEFELPDYANNDGAHYEDEEDNFDAEEDFSDLLYAADDEPGAEDETVEAAQLARAAAVVGRVLSKIRKLSIKVLHSSTSLRPIWFAVVKELHLPPRSLPRDMDNRWNSTFLLVQFVLQYKLAVDAFTKSKVVLKPFTLRQPDWTLLDQLSTLLKPLFIYTEFFSCSNFAGICYAIRCLHHIDRTLAAFISGQYSPALIAAARLGRLKLQKYKAILQHKKLYLFAAVFNPAMRTAWFRHSDRQGEFSAAWINELVQQISEEFKEKYLPLDTQNVPEAEESPMSVEALLFGPSPVKSTSRRTVGPPSELERYLSQPIETTNDIIKWWWDRRKLYPHLHQMATDYCSVPATTVDVERLFSTGRILIDWLRNRLTGDSAHTLLCLKSWWDAEIINDGMFEFDLSEIE